MVLDRDELAARLAVADFANPSFPNEGGGREAKGWADFVVEHTDALLSRLRPSAPDAPATDPRRTVGAVVRDDNWRDWIVVGDGLIRNVERDIHAITLPLIHTKRFSRWATREECERHSIPYVARPLPGAPGAAPSRPEWVRITGLPWEGVGLYPFTVGQACKVLDWRGRSPRVAGSGRDRVTLSALGASVDPANRGYATWEPCAAPSPSPEPAATPADAPAFDEAREREAAMEAYRAGTDGCIDPDGTKYPTCRDSFRNGWLARARRAAPLSKPVDREGLMSAMQAAWYASDGGWIKVADAVIAFLKANGGAK